MSVWLAETLPKCLDSNIKLERGVREGEALTTLNNNLTYPHCPPSLNIETKKIEFSSFFISSLIQNEMQQKEVHIVRIKFNSIKKTSILCL